MLRIETGLGVRDSIVWIPGTSATGCNEIYDLQESPGSFLLRGEAGVSTNFDDGSRGALGTLVAVREDRPSSNARHRHHALVAHVLDTGLVEMKYQIARLRRRSTLPGM